ncbi:MAG: hypothetical protein RMK65_04835 [Anaerolineae bacterium]|nr:hypothetical protein [Anaerolineae bacterium]
MAWKYSRASSAGRGRPSRPRGRTTRISSAPVATIQARTLSRSRISASARASGSGRAAFIRAATTSRRLSPWRTASTSSRLSSAPTRRRICPPPATRWATPAAATASALEEKNPAIRS